jgi:hypothetical protein
VFRSCLSSEPLKLVSDSCRPDLLAKRNWFSSPLDQTLAVTRGFGSVLIGWMHSEENHDLYFLPSIICVIRSTRVIWAWHLARTGDGRDACKALVGPQGKIPLGWPKRRWEDNIRMNLQEIVKGWTGLIWLRKEQVAGYLEHCKETSGSINTGYFFTSWETRSFSRRTLLLALRMIWRCFCCLFLRCVELKAMMRYCLRPYCGCYQVTTTSFTSRATSLPIRSHSQRKQS